MLPRNIGIQIRQKRIEQKMTLDELAEASDCSVAFISRIERQATDSISLAKLLDVLQALGMHPSDIFGVPALGDDETTLWGVLRSLPDGERHQKIIAILELLK